MKRYKLKIDTPWGRKGTQVEELRFLYGVWGGYPNEYPDLFEEIEEKTNEQLLELYLAENFLRYDGSHHNRVSGHLTEFLSLEFFKRLRQKYSV